MNTPRNFSLQLGALLTLYLSLIGLLLLVFNTINLALPDATESYWQVDSYQSTARVGIAMLVVFFPTYLLLTRTVNKLRRNASEAEYLGLTRWLIYLSLVVGGGILLGDLVVVIMSFLEGDLTTRFLLKASALLLVVGIAFYYYLNDARGKRVENASGSMLFGTIALAVAVTALAFGFYHIESPQTAREREIDRAQVQDLQEIQFEIESYIRINEEVPESLSAVYENSDWPTAPEDRAAYTYAVTENGFELCAEFALSSPELNQPSLRRPLPPDADVFIENGDDWSYSPGNHCFARQVLNINNNE